MIVIIGENHSFDNVFATYGPPAGQTVDNLLSEGIVTAQGGLGSHASLARQEQASDTKAYQLDPADTGPFTTLPQPNTTYLSQACKHGLGDFDTQATNGTLPAVSFLKPGDDDGHPGYSTLAAFEQFVTHAIDEVQNNPLLWSNTAIFVTFDEEGGYYDSGYIQPVSFFGDGTRVPMIVVSPYSKPGYISHTYTDHVSILKFIERNWGLPVLSSRSLDRLPNPTASSTNPYVPTNSPAIGDLFDMFNFNGKPAKPAALPAPRPVQTGPQTFHIAPLQR